MSLLPKPCTFDAVDRLLTVSTTGAVGAAQNNSYTYDLVGNLTQRVDPLVTENFSYDSLNRLYSSSGPGLVTKVYDYDALGNITYKSDVGVYTYGTKPHAVTSTSGIINAAYTYDANGNLTSGNGRTLTPTSFNMPAALTGNGVTYTYTYNAEHKRVRLVHSTLGTFIYLHPGGGGQLLYEKEIKPSGLIEHKHYISGGSGLIGVYLTRSDSTTEMRYFLKDNLGSIRMITTSTGATPENLGYAAFGKRRSPNGADDPNNTLSGAYAHRGFTAHEHLEEIALIHMNGRIYDPLLARFTTPDPFLSDPRNLQNFNRYAYALNSPLNFIDPTGYDDEPLPRVVITGTNDFTFNRAFDHWIDRVAWDASRNVGSPGGERGTPGEGAKPARPQAHNYTVKTLTSCSASDSFASVKSPGGSGPGAPAAQEGFTPRINLWGFESPNPISQDVNSSTMTITNVTLPGHVFYLGSVTINVNSVGPSSSTITYHGTGTSSTPIWNNIVGYLYFGLVNALTTIGCAASSGLGGAPGP